MAESRRYGNHLGVEFGTVYQSSAVIADGTQPPDVADSYSDYVPSATPGARAPHVWLGHPEARLSTLDLFGSAFTLLAAPGGDAWCTAAAEVERELGVPIDRYRIGAPGLRDLGGFTEAYGLGEDGAVLVRPDGHVAWRSATRTGDRRGAARRRRAHRRSLARSLAELPDNARAGRSALRLLSVRHPPTLQWLVRVDRLHGRLASTRRRVAPSRGPMHAPAWPSCWRARWPPRVQL